ncbi:unnamed protein product [Tilletia controversa]|nr:unnamed protein product [Tilletia controversa]
MSPRYTKTSGSSERHAQAAAAPAGDAALSTMLASAERKATHFRSFRAQIRSTHQHGRGEAAAAQGSRSGSSTQRPPRAGPSQRTLPRVRTDATWTRFFGENSDAEELEASPVTLVATRPRNTAVPSLSASAKGKQPVRTDDSILASTAAAQSPIASTLSPEEKAQHFGPNYLAQEDSLRNDFSQWYVDSGAGELPGNAVRNPFLASRFDEYPKLKRLVQIKEELVSAKAHPPTYLYADLRASLVPASQYHQQRRNLQKVEAVGSSTSEAGVAGVATRAETDGHQAGDVGGDAAAGPSEPGSSKGSRTSSSATSLSNMTSLTSASASTAVATAATAPVEPTTSIDPQIPAPQPFHLSALMPIKYDVVIIDPPLEVYDWEGVPTRKSGASGLDGPQIPFAQTSAAAPDPKQTWTWDQIANLPIPQLTAKESFVFLWVGSGAGDGLERGRELLAKWGYRRCEDIVWVRTNRGAAKTQHGDGEDSLRQSSTSSVLQRSVQHCLMGIRGTVRRSSDTRFVHCNVDIDVVIWEGEDDHAGHDSSSSTRESGGGSYPKAQDHVRAKPQEMYSLIENFCSGTRRLELFGTNRNLRRGWLTVGLEVGPHVSGFPEALPASYSTPQQQNSHEQTQQPPAELQKEGDDAGPAPIKMVEPVAYQKQMYDSYFGVDRPGCDLRERKNLLPFSPDIDALRPKSPAPRNAHSRVDSDNPLTPPPSGALSLHGPHGSGSPSSGLGWASSPAAHGNGQQGPTASAVPPSVLSSPRASPRASMTARTLQHKMSMSPTTFVTGMNLPALPMQQQLAFGPGSPQGPGSPTRSRHGAPVHNHHHHHHHSHHPGGAGLSGLGAGGPKVVSVPSGSETLSGPQASVLFGTKHAKGTGPMGLGRGSRR